MRFFQLHELVDRNTFHRFGDDAWRFLESDALDMLDGIREFFNAPVTVNNWWEGKGSFQFRGYRPPDCTVGAPHSHHRTGKAFDFDVKGYIAEDARRIILENQDNPLLSKIQRMEADVHWVHADIGTVPGNRQRIYVFKA